MVSVSAIRRIRLLRQRFRGDGVLARQPLSQVRHLAAFAAEWTPGLVHRSLPAVDAQRVFGGAQTHPFYRRIGESTNRGIGESTNQGIGQSIRGVIGAGASGSARNAAI